jgi:hypothetical protein
MKNEDYRALQIITITCNIYTMIQAIRVMYVLLVEVKGSKKNKELIRKKMYLYSCAVVSLLLV